jgi:hypothetical protein
MFTRKRGIFSSSSSGMFFVAVMKSFDITRSEFVWHIDSVVTEYLYPRATESILSSC